MSTPLETGKAALSLGEAKKEAYRLMDEFNKANGNLSKEASASLKGLIAKLNTLIQDNVENTFSSEKFEGLRSEIEKLLTSPTSIVPQPLAVTAPVAAPEVTNNAEVPVKTNGNIGTLAAQIGEKNGETLESLRDKLMAKVVAPNPTAITPDGTKEKKQKPPKPPISKSEIPVVVTPVADKEEKDGKPRNSSKENNGKKEGNKKTKEEKGKKTDKEKTDEAKIKNPVHDKDVSPEWDPTKNLGGLSNGAIEDFRARHARLTELSSALRNRDDFEDAFKDATKYTDELAALLEKDVRVGPLNQKEVARAAFLEDELDGIVRMAEKELAEQERVPDEPPPQIDYGEEERMWKESEDKNILKFKILDGEILELYKELAGKSKIDFEEANKIATDLSDLLLKDSLGKLSKLEKKNIRPLAAALRQIKKEAKAELSSLKKKPAKSPKRRGEEGTYAPSFSARDLINNKNVIAGNIIHGNVTIKDQASEMQEKVNSYIKSGDGKETELVATPEQLADLEKELQQAVSSSDVEAKTEKHPQPAAVTPDISLEERLKIDRVEADKKAGGRKKNKKEEPKEDEEPLLLTKEMEVKTSKGDDFYRPEDFAANETAERVAGLSAEYQGKVASLEETREKYAKIYAQTLKEQAAKGRVTRIKEKLVGQKIDVDALPKDHPLHKASDAYYASKEDWFKTRLNEAEFIYGGGKEKNAVQHANLYGEFVIKEHDKILERRTEALTPKEKGLFGKIWQMYAKQNTFVKVGISTLAVTGIAAAAGAVPVVLLFAGARYVRALLSVGAGVIAGESVGAALAYSRNQKFGKQESEAKQKGTTAIGAGMQPEFLKDLDKAHVVIQEAKAKRKRIDTLIKAGTALAVGGSASFGAGYAAPNLGQALENTAGNFVKGVLGGTEDVSKTKGTSIVSEARVKILEQSVVGKEEAIGQEIPTTEKAIPTVEPEQVSEISARGNTFITEIKPKGNIWNSVQDILREKPQEFGWKGEGTPDQKWLDKETAKILNANPDKTKVNLVHAGDKVLLEKLPGGGIRLNMDYASGLKAGTLPEVGNDNMPVPEKGANDNLGAATESAPKDSPRDTHVGTGKEAILNNMQMSEAAEANLRGRVDALFGVRGFFNRVEGVDSLDWKRLKVLNARAVLEALTSSDPEAFKLPDTNNVVDFAKVRLAEAIKQGIALSGIQPGKAETVEQFLFTQSFEEIKKMNRPRVEIPTANDNFPSNKAMVA